MKIPRVYVDTSVLGGCFDKEFSRWSNGLMEDFRAERFVPVLSDLLAAEVSRAPAPVRAVHADLLAVSSDRIAVSGETLDLLAGYEAHSVLGPRYRADMLHIALATVAGVDVPGKLELQAHRSLR